MNYITEIQHFLPLSVSHTKTALIGPSIQIPITNGTLNLGTWQGVYLCEV
jgi:thiamine phosphate synthase YjbQ (UPF0047 family)